MSFYEQLQTTIIYFCHEIFFTITKISENVIRHMDAGKVVALMLIDSVQPARQNRQLDSAIV